MEVISLPLKIVNYVLAHAQSKDEEEICGLIAGSDGKMNSVYPIQNVSQHRECLYQMDGQEQINAMRSMRENNEELYAIYHSHPHSTAYPSATDVAESLYPKAVYLIVSLDTKGVLDLRGYRLVKGQVDVLQVVVQEGGGKIARNLG